MIADTLIRGALVHDGTGAPPFVADVAVTDDRVAAVGSLHDCEAGVVLDATGRVLSPGFIDVHTHDDRALFDATLLECKLSQGVTTVVTGNCGVSLAPLQVSRRPPPPLDLIGREPADYFARFADYLDALDAHAPLVNAACQVGHSSLRVGAMDSLQRVANARETQAMRAALEASLEAGAIGLSTGLAYKPAEHASTAEVIEIAAALQAYGALHSTHMRDESAGVLDSLDESAAIGRDAGVPVIVSHHKCSGIDNFGRSVDTLARIDAIAAAQPFAMDVYPYDASSTVLEMAMKREARRVMITWSEALPAARGRDLAELAREHGVSDAEMAERLQPAGAIYFAMDEADVRRILAHPRSMIGSDGLPHDSHPHPRLWGTFARVLGHYARDIGLFSLADAVHKMTGLSAAQFGCTDRGAIRAGAFADLTLFDADRILDRATFEAPCVPAAGIDWVMVNGRMAWRDGAATGVRAGRALRRR